MLTKLIGRTGDVANREFIIPEDATALRLGAAPASEICIRAEGVSREHARIVRRADGCWIEDAGSSNGTFINGQRLKSERLRHLDVVTLARHVDLIFVQSEKEAAPAARPILSAWVEFLNGPRAGATVEIPVGELIIGRSAASHVHISNPAVGKSHARIVRTGGQVTLEDLQSANKTFVNDRPVAGAVLADGDRISIAGVVQLRARLMHEFGPAFDAPMTPRGDDGPTYDQEWRTRLVWSPTERLEIEKNVARALQMMESPAKPSPKLMPKPAEIGRVAREPVPADRGPRQDPVQAKETEPVRPRLVRAVELTGGPEGPVTLTPGRHIIGRHVAANVRLGENDVKASRTHAQLTVSAEAVSVEDRSANGTFVNGKRIAKPQRLGDGDQLQCGATTFVVKIVF